MPRYLLALALSGLLLSACGKEEPPKPVVAEVPTPVVTEPQTPEFNADIDADTAFDEALGEASVEDANTFNEVVDDIDADTIQAAEPGDKLAQFLASEAGSQAQAELEIQQAARAEMQSLDAPTGLQIRPYSEDLYVQVKGVKPAVLYFTADDCTVCDEWEADLRADADTYADTNALVLLANFNEEPDLVDSMNIPEPGYAMMLTGMGELMGPRPSDRLTSSDLAFIFQ